MAVEEIEDVMNKRETTMEDGRRKLYYFTFGSEAEAMAPTDDVDAKEAQDNE
jgi:hypothetical protein